MSASEACELPDHRTSSSEASEIMKRIKKIAVVGCSATPGKPGHDIPKYLVEHGYTIFPVNPMVQGEILGRKVYASLKDLPEPVDAVEIFRKPQDVPPVVEEAIAVKASVVWMQTGIVNNEAAAKARAAGLTVVMDQCMMVVHTSLSR